MGSTINGVTAGVAQDDLVMPVIDFAKFVHGTPEEKQTTAQQVSHAFRTSGFLYLSNHGIHEDDVRQAFSHSAKFFARDQSQKDSLAWTTPKANRGYVPPGREKNTDLTDPAEVAKLRDEVPDLKESMEIGREGEEGHPNQWPRSFDADGAAFTEYMQNFFLSLKNLHVLAMRAIAVGMLGGLEAEHFFDTYTAQGDNTLRLLHYPPVKKSVFRSNPKTVRIGAHSDYGSITLLFQDDVGGLEVKSPRRTWVRARPIPGTIVVNAGDLLARWSNDLIKSTKHRVVQPPPNPDDLEDVDEDATFPARYSMAYFCNPDFVKWIEALPGTYGEGAVTTEKKYEGINSGDYLVQRLAATY